MLAWTLALAPVFGHHSFMAEYDASKPVRLQGVVTRFDFVNPHSEILLAVDSVNWSVELSSPAGLLRRGVSRTMIHAGMRVKIEGYRSKDGGNRIYGLKVALDDGRVFALNAPDSR